VTVGGILAPPLTQGPQISLNPDTGHGQKWPHDAALRKAHDRVNPGEPLRPGAAEELGQHGFGLVVQRVRGGYGVSNALTHQLTEPAIAQAAGGFLDRLGGFPNGRVGDGRCSSIDLGFVKGQPEFFGQFAAEIAVRIGFSSPQPVVKMGDVEHESQFPASLRKSPQQCNRVRAARNPHSEAQAWPQQRSVHFNRR